ncbi:MAG: ATP-binding cassette domain-containing protein [Streptosporangiales bacterium]|nr:ATP-binding cassette domain-containing protein [Streptosporangiales bacterium]
MSDPAEPMIELRDVVKRYHVPGRGDVRALENVNIRVERGETLGLVGESGCGKSTAAQLLVRLERPTSGVVRVAGIDVPTARGAALRRLRRTVQLVFQDPYASLNPRLRVGDAIAEVLTVHGDRGETRERVTELLGLVGLDASTADRYPGQLSGGQRQRVGIARALAVRPEVLVLDEPVSALDVSVRAEVMNLIVRLREELGLTCVFISHDLGMVRHVADRIAVMYLGEIVELGSWRTVSDHPAHPYAQALQDAVPVPDPAVHEAAATPLTGEVPDAARPPAGCTFHPRCPLAEDVCRSTPPHLLPIRPRRGDETEHDVSCHVVARTAGISD